ncbi:MULTISPECIES: cytochrome c maturation protein CcmE [unclassified Aureispira]|uniref:cytochrome c maturation protein CcmE domain-containing protein n=1 Tax=unclassified Aureispira TaxID=2649989 RepID=UPI00069698B7|nr:MULTISPECIES: cytochrome c maturation protein CcmE [unclassified Aureispira]WMX16287.1 cytochrome c maturation protein CcmE [Aureispira sp. CCB-E]
MKKTHIIGLIAIAIAIASLIAIAGDASTYTDFATALENPNAVHQVVGHLSIDKEVVYNPEADANSFTFFMKDEKGKEMKVLCQKEKPAEFERSEQIVLKGQMKGDLFVAHDILLKCPSKYQDEKLQNENIIYGDA